MEITVKQTIIIKPILNTRLHVSVYTDHPQVLKVLMGSHYVINTYVI